MALNEPWSIKSRAHVCAVTEQHFKDGEAFYTAIFPDPESSGYIRKDFSKGAWESRGEDGETPFSFWGSIYRAPVKEEEVEVTDESPEDLLRRLIEEDEEHTENARYILAVMLERKKLLVEADSQPVGDGIIRIYEHRKTGDVFIVKDPNIPLSEVDKVQEEVTMLLENGGRVPEPEIQEAGGGDQVSGNGSQGPGAPDEEAEVPASSTDEEE
ncbi:MAG: hypothetical protein H7A51_03385 [Akkermansiaceae bacterium]|nr:hypothetical protein [Akkermansiaceae bacterium]